MFPSVKTLSTAVAVFLGASLVLAPAVHAQAGCQKEMPLPRAASFDCDPDPASGVSGDACLKAWIKRPPTPTCILDF